MESAKLTNKTSLKAKTQSWAKKKEEKRHAGGEKGCYSLGVGSGFYISENVPRRAMGVETRRAACFCLHVKVDMSGFARNLELQTIEDYRRTFPQHRRRRFWEETVISFLLLLLSLSLYIHISRSSALQRALLHPMSAMSHSYQAILCFKAKTYMADYCLASG